MAAPCHVFCSTDPLANALIRTASSTTQHSAHRSTALAAPERTLKERVGFSAGSGVVLLTDLEVWPPCVGLGRPRRFVSGLPLWSRTRSATTWHALGQRDVPAVGAWLAGLSFPSVHGAIDDRYIPLATPREKSTFTAAISGSFKRCHWFVIAREASELLIEAKCFERTYRRCRTCCTSEQTQTKARHAILKQESGNRWSRH